MLEAATGRAGDAQEGWLHSSCPAKVSVGCLAMLSNAGLSGDCGLQKHVVLSGVGCVVMMKATCVGPVPCAGLVLLSLVQ